MIKPEFNLIKSNSIVGFSEQRYSQYLDDIDTGNAINRYDESEINELIIKVYDTKTTFIFIETYKLQSLITEDLLIDFLDSNSYSSAKEYNDSYGDSNTQKRLNDYIQERISPRSDSISSRFKPSFISLSDLRVVAQSLEKITDKASKIKSFTFDANAFIDDIFDDYRGKLENLGKRADSIVSSAFLQGNTRTNIKTRVDDKMNELTFLLGDENKKLLQSDTEKKILKSVGDIDQPNVTDQDVDNAGSLVSRIPESISDTIKEKYEEIKDWLNNLETSTKDAKSKSNDVVKASVDSGRPAVAESDIAAKCKEWAQGRVNGVIYGNEGSGNSQIDKYLDVPSSHPDPSSWSNLTFVNGNVLNMSTGGTSVTEWGYHPDVGYYKTDIKVLTMLNEVAKAMGKRIQINSAYRPPEYNRRICGASKSYHLRGLALDCHMGGINRSEFVRLCREIGFGGIGYYSSFIHVDTGPKRQWG